jgi:hypothetical protein
MYVYIYHEWVIPAQQSSPTIAIATSKTGTPKEGADVGLTPKAGKFPEPAVIPKAGDFGGGRRGGGLCSKYSLFAAQSGMILWGSNMSSGMILSGSVSPLRGLESRA